MTDPAYLAPFVRSFFEDHLVCRRNVSRNTIQSYRDAVKLLLALRGRTTQESRRPSCWSATSRKRSSSPS